MDWVPRLTRARANRLICATLGGYFQHTGRDRIAIARTATNSDPRQNDIRRNGAFAICKRHIRK